MDLREKLSGKHFLLVESEDADWKFTFGLYFDALQASFEYVDEVNFLGSGLDNTEMYPSRFDGVIIHLVSGGYYDSYKQKAVEAKQLGVPTVVTASSQTMTPEKIAELLKMDIGVMLKNKSFDINTILMLLASQMS